MMVIAMATLTRVVFCSRGYESLPRILKRLVRARWRVVQTAAIRAGVGTGRSRATATEGSRPVVGRLEQ